MARPIDESLKLVRIPTTSAAEIASQAGLSPGAMELVQAEQTPRELLEALVAAAQYPQAIRFLAFALPRREGVWWGALYLLWAGAGKLHAQDALALQAITRWVLEPTDENREQTAPFARIPTPSGHLAKAVLRTGGSMLPPKYPVRPPAPTLTPRSITTAVTGIALKGEAKTLQQRLRQAVSLGMLIARGLHLWQSATPPVHPSEMRRTTGS